MPVGRIHTHEVPNVSAQARAARRTLDRGEGLVLRDLADLYRKGEEMIFQTHGGAIGRPWKPLASSTVKARARMVKRFGLQVSAFAPTLVLFGDLRDAMTKKGGAHHQLVTGRKVELWVDQPRVNRHNRKKGLGIRKTDTGRNRKIRGKAGRMYPENIVEIHDEGRGKVPARPVIGVPDSVEREMERRVERFFDNVANKLGFS